MKTNNNIPFKMMQIPLILSGLVYFLLAIFFFTFPTLVNHLDNDHASGTEANESGQLFLFIFIGVFSLILGFIPIVFSFFVRKPKPIIFYLSIAATALYIPSAYIIFGIPMLLFLLKKEVREYYQVTF
ncbi:MAG: hypothetical protein MK193_02885 [Lentisphaeria bacterium]|nr:hypothetical protein [Lentisphaeria bacterium]